MSSADRDAALERIGEAGRSLSDAMVLFHEVLAGELGLTSSQWKVLGLIQRDGVGGAGDLSATSGLAPASITGILDRLEDRGLVSREADPSDRRRTVVTLRPEGMHELYARFSGLMARLATLHEGYSVEELTLVAGYLEKAAAAQREATAELRGEG